MRALAVLLLLGVTPATGSTDPRSLEVVHYECRLGDERNATTLFGNGTIRRLTGPLEAPEMVLSELDPDARDRYLDRLAAETLDKLSWSVAGSLDGVWTESCRLVLNVPEGPQAETRFTAFDTLTLDVRRVLSIVDELAVWADSQARLAGLARDYVPKAGDVLVHRDGTRYVVRSLTSDKKAVELSGIDQPLTVYFLLEGLSGEFLAVEERPN